MGNSLNTLAGIEGDAHAVESDLAYGPENPIYRRFSASGIERHRTVRPVRRIAQDGLQVARRRHPSWGGKKLLALVHKRHRNWDLPHRSTVCDILSRHGMVPKKRSRRRIGHPGKPTSSILAPNDLWCADFKGQFKTGNGRYCYPLTVTDGFSRYLLGCQGLNSTSVEESKPVFTQLFREYGLPKRIRTDNGVPFATNTLARLSKLSAWWVRLGVLPELIEPGKPQQNGRHERMHRTLKAEATRPAAASLPAQQRKFNTFREEFNHVRPHEALDQQTPASFYRSSNRSRTPSVGSRVIMHDPIPGSAPIGNYATLRRRSALSFHHYEKENGSTDITFCNPCLPTFLLPISPAGQRFRLNPIAPSDK
jgi:transposase InsO family protein